VPGARGVAGRAAKGSTASAIGVEWRAITKTFPGLREPALADVSLRVQAGEFFTILGPSGCGKSTLLRIAAGFEHQDTGSVLVDGSAVDRLPPHHRPINTVFQSYAIFPHLTVAQNVGYGPRMLGWSRPAIAARVHELLHLVKLDGLNDRHPAKLSGGQRQRVALARALASRPKVLLLDEPLSALDFKLRSEMRGELKRLQLELGTTFVFVTHDQHEALSMSDRVAVLRAGRIEQVGSASEIYDRPCSRFVADFIGETNLLAAQRVGGDKYRLSDSDILLVAEPLDSATEVFLAIRPERVILGGAETALLRARVTNTVYGGADRMIELALPGGQNLRARVDAGSEAGSQLQPGDETGVTLPQDAIRVLPP